MFWEYISVFNLFLSRWQEDSLGVKANQHEEGGA